MFKYMNSDSHHWRMPLVTFVAAILFADKLCLMAPTRKSMQMLLTICEEYCSEYCLTINAKKVKLWFLVTYMVVMYFRQN